MKTQKSVDTKVPDREGIVQLWTSIKTLLSGKVDTKTLEGYPTIESVATAIATALQDYPTDEEMKTEIASALGDYMTEAEVNAAIVEAVKSVSGLSYEPVEELPETGESNVIYLLPNGNEGEDDYYDEWFYYNGKWERLGTGGMNLAGYWSKEELEIMTSEEMDEILNGLEPLE